jgi:hypothetical protein
MAATYTGQNEHGNTHTSMPRAEFEPTTPVSEREKIFRAFYLTATKCYYYILFLVSLELFLR